MFWAYPLTRDDSFSYLAVVLQVHVVVLLILGFVWVFGYLADKAFDL
jgi:hypothetical protein